MTVIRKQPWHGQVQALVDPGFFLVENFDQTPATSNLPHHGLTLWLIIQTTKHGGEGSSL